MLEEHGTRDGQHDDTWPADGLEQVSVCPLCGSSRRKILHSGLTDFIFFCAPGKWTLHQCLACGCGYLDPRPTAETIHLAYRQYYTHSHTASGPLAVPQGRMHRFRRALANGYHNWRFGTDFKPAGTLGVAVAWLIPAVRHRLEHDVRNLSRPAPGARLLDIGFGDASFLEVAQAAGWEVAGADPDRVSVESARARGLAVREGGVEAFADMPGCFDLVTLNHVIEHVHHPAELVHGIHRLLKPGGQLWVETPNLASFGHRDFGRYWRGLEPPRHLVLFTWNTLATLLEEQGFSALKRVTRNYLYRALAIQSRAILESVEPEQAGGEHLCGHLRAARLALLTGLNYRHSEFVTLLATKAPAAPA